MSVFAIRPALVDNIPEIIEIQKGVWWETYESILGKEQCDYMFNDIYSSPSLQAQIEVLKHQFFILYGDNIACGLASFSDLGSDAIFKLHKIYVSPGRQGKGAGRFLLSAMENQIASQGGEEVRLNVNRYNPARNFYEAMGYSVLYEEDIPIGNFWMNDYVMGKKLIAFP